MCQPVRHSAGHPSATSARATRRTCGLAWRLAYPIALGLAAAFWLPVSRATAQVPADAGQVWKTYDIAPFVTAAGTGSEKHVVDWVLQETGYAAWHGDRPASLSAGPEKLACFHVAEMQARVAEIVDRFVAEASRPHRFTVRVFGIGSAAWRGEARPLLQSISTATPGVQAWIVAREDAAQLIGRLRARSDCQELPTGAVLAANGLPAVVSGGRTLDYVRDVAPPDFRPVPAACDEGFAIDVHPLLSADGTAVDAVFRCRIDQVERLATVSLPTPAGARGRPQVQVPQVAAVRVGERFRWPASQALLVGLGLVPWPVPAQNGTAAAVPDAKRRDVIVVIEPRLQAGP